MHPPTLPVWVVLSWEKGGPWGYPWMLYPKRVRFDPSAKGGTPSNPIESLDNPPQSWGGGSTPPHQSPSGGTGVYSPLGFGEAVKVGAVTPKHLPAALATLPRHQPLLLLTAVHSSGTAALFTLLTKHRSRPGVVIINVPALSSTSRCCHRWVS